jgi:hypothetical protein
MACWIGEAEAAEVADVLLADQIEVAGVPLRLNGAGLRTRLFLDVYVMGLYLPAPTARADAVLRGGQLRRVHLAMKRDVAADTIWEAFAEGIRKNTSAAELAALAPPLAQIEQLFREIGDVAAGDSIDIDFRADGAVDVAHDGRPRGSVAPSADLQRALLSIWLGAKPVQEDLKRALLSAGSARQE